MSLTPQAAARPQGGLRRLGSLAVAGPNGLEPELRLPELAQLLAPGRQLPALAARPVGVTAGVWIFSGGAGESWLVKEVRHQRRSAGLPTEVEQCDMLLKKFPGLTSDRRIAFPHSVVQLQTRDTREHCGDLLVSRVAPGVQLGRFLAMLDLSIPKDQCRLEQVSQAVGERLAEFHNSYADPVTGEATHHRDFHPSNVLYDEASNTVCFVDLSGMGTWGPKDDVEKFARLMKQLAGERYANAFEVRYNAVIRRSPSLSRGSSVSERVQVPLYTPMIEVAHAHPKGFKRLGSLMVPTGTFEPSQHLTTLCWMMWPNRQLKKPSVQKFGSASNVWILSDGNDENCLLKLAASKRKMLDVPTEAENVEDMAWKYPALVRDARLAFPHSIIPLQSETLHFADLLISRVPAGQQLTQYMATLDMEDRQDQRKFESVCGEVGAVLANFHAKYRDAVTGQVLQHQDLHPNNVYYDAATSSICIADLSSMGSNGPNDDVQKFARLLSKWAGEPGNRYADAFELRYKSAARTAGLSTHSAKRRVSMPALANLMWFNCVADRAAEDVESESGSDAEDLKSPSKDHACGGEESQCGLM